MTDITPERVTEQARALTPEQQQLRALLDSWLTPLAADDMEERERQFVNDMVAKDAFSHVPTGRRFHPDPQPIVVQGEPVSETIIRERH